MAGHEDYRSQLYIDRLNLAFPLRKFFMRSRVIFFLFSVYHGNMTPLINDFPN